MSGYEKIAVVGSRDFGDYEILKKVLDALRLKKGFKVIISGGAAGADSMAEFYAEENGLGTIIFKPDWNTYGKSAGFIRNQRIWDAADFGVAFWDGESKGTAHSLEISRKQNKELFIYNFKTGEFYKNENN